MLQVAEDVENRIDEARLESDRGLIHEQHLRIHDEGAADFEEPPLSALTRFAEGLKRFAARNGAAGLYHETITWAYLFLIHERKARGEAGESWEEFAARNPDLLTWKPSVLAGYYREETLASDLARRVFVMPDRLAKALGEHL